MKIMNRMLLTGCLLFSACLFASAQEDVFTVTASLTKMGLEDAVQVTYKFSGQAQNMDRVSFTDFNVVNGPFQSQSSSTTFVNGVSETKSSISLTYVLRPTHTGMLTIPSAQISGKDGTTFRSNELTVEVVEGHIATPPKTEDETDDPFARMHLDMHFPDMHFPEMNFPDMNMPDMHFPDMHFRDRQPNSGKSHADGSKRELSDNNANVTAAVRDSKYKYVVSYGPVYGDNYPETEPEGITDAKKIGTYYWFKNPRTYYVVNDTTGIRAKINAINASDTSGIYSTLITSTNGWSAFKEEQQLENQNMAYLTIDRMREDKMKKNPAFIFSFASAKDRARFSQAAKKDGYTVTDNPVKKSEETEAAFTATVSGKPTTKKKQLFDMAGKLLAIAATTDGSFENLVSK